MNEKWQLDKRLNLGIVVQVLLLASLILGSWMNLQRQLDILQHDMNRLIETQKEWHSRLDELSSKCLSSEFRINVLEKNQLNGVVK
jgi:flagellar biosynthesis chaperone FliJ